MTNDDSMAASVMKRLFLVSHYDTGLLPCKRLAPALLAGVVFLAACGRKDEAASPAPVSRSAAGVVCSYAPGQHDLVGYMASAAGGAATASAAVAKAAGLTAVLHSSGAYIFTGTAGYVAGTLGTAGALPALVATGTAAGGAAITMELLCVPANHPELVRNLERMASEFMVRGKDAVAVAGRHTGNGTAVVTANVRQIMIRTNDHLLRHLNPSADAAVTAANAK